VNVHEVDVISSKPLSNP